MIQITIPEKGEIIPIRKKLPRGVLTYVAKQYDLSWTAVKDVADGKIDRPDVYRSLLERTKEIVREMQMIEAKKAENLKIYKTIYNE